jgi:tripartite-type tricarboxylate transporter receptor subunit TctC
MVHIAYNGIDPALTDLIAGHIPVALTPLSSALPHVESGTARLLAVLEPERFASVPEVPSLTEFVPAFRKPPTWFGLFAPRGTREAVIARLNAEIVTILNEPDIRRLMADNGYAVIGGPPSRLTALMVDGIARFGDIVHAAGIEPQ